ncbi:Superfamily I DNA and RNA helicase and helicase subunit [Sphingomonas sp. SKA58]|nr:Superfamily I DNA and RNA helicase and helicase subunit [Sphingomonas sp. SKA58]
MGADLKINNSGRGLHEREVRGVSALTSLPPEWFAYTNLDLATTTGHSREIDVIIVAEDRILVIDLKEWRGPIDSRDGHWFNDSRDHGPSPVGKILSNARTIYTQLETHLRKYTKDKNVVVPKVQGLVVLTTNADFSGISETERMAVVPVTTLVPALKSFHKRIELLGKASPAGNLTSPEWKAQLSKFFNVSKGVFVPGRRTYGGYYATSTDSVFEHPEGVYAEFEASDERPSPTLGVLRLWDFTKAQPHFQTEQGRSEIAGREQEVVAYLQDRCDQCDAVLVDGKVRDPEFGVRYWEVYDRRRRLLRLNDFATNELSDLSRSDRIELARQLLTSVDALHLAGAAHLDLGQHSVWVQRPSTVKLSHLMAASYPDVRSLGESRFQFLATGKLPEDLFDVPSSPTRRDVFLAASAVHRLLFNVPPSANSGFSEWDSGADAEGEFLELHGWLGIALSADPAVRFANAGEALSAFNAAVAVRPTPAEVIEGLERHRGSIKTQLDLFMTYPPQQPLRDDDARAMWRTSKDGRELLVKVWKRASWGDQQKEGPRILDFLDRVAEIAAGDLGGCAPIVGAMWLGDAIVMIQEWIDRPDLASLIDGASGHLDRPARLSLVASLCSRVEELHTLRLAHGDLKPANILVDPTRPEDPVLIDLLDFSSASDGERISSAYVPESGGRFERDCFAVTVIAEQLFADDECSVAGRARLAINKIRMDEPANATLMPLLDALSASEPEAREAEPLRVFSPHVAAGRMLADEGRYYLRMPPRKRMLVLRGACEELEIRLDVAGKPIRIERRDIEQSRIRRVERHEFGSFEGSIVVEDGAVTDVTALLPVLERDDVVKAVTEAIGQITQEQDAVEQDPIEDADESSPSTEDGVVSSEPPEDDLIEAIAAQSHPSGKVDVARLWKLLVDAERELITYGHVSEDSVYERSSNRHKVQFDLHSGSLDYNRRDRVLVEREDRRGNWRPIGQLDLQRSKPDHLFIESFRAEQSNGAALTEEGDELRFRSRMEETSLDRRQAAVTRIVGRQSRTRNLIDIFDPRTGATPFRLTEAYRTESLKEQYALNDLQAQALASVLGTRPLALVQGPPGTGKTVFIAALVHAALTLGLARNVLLASQAHEAVNNAAEAVLKLFANAGEVPSILRVGNEGVVSDRLLPFHVERVEQLQKDRFRAEMRERLAIAAQGLGIPDSLRDALVHVELAIRPVATKLVSLSGDDGTQRRAEALWDTIEQQIGSLELGGTVDRATPAESILPAVVDACLKAVPLDIRPSADKVARFQAVAALARDFVGTVSTEQRSLETFLAGTRQIVAGTCVGLGRSALGLTSTPFDLVIVDEAARCTASELAVPIQAGAWVVLVGDHKQLEPQHPESVVEEVSDRLDTSVAEVARSDFERVFETAYGRAAGHTLQRQYRMLPPIGKIVSDAFYDGHLEHGRTKPMIDADVIPDELVTPVTWFNTASYGKRARQSDRNHRGSLTNTVEADVIVQMLRRWSECTGFIGWLEQPSAHAHAIGIICAYAAQRDLLKRKIAMAAIHPSLQAALKVDTIDSYQGKENPIVIVSLVRNNWDGAQRDGIGTIRPGFLAKQNRINVAISRAMDRLVVVGSLSRWEADGPMDRIASAFERNLESGDAAEIDALVFLEGEEQTSGTSRPDDNILDTVA